MNTLEIPLVLKDWHGISEPQATIQPGQTSAPPVLATSPFQVKGYVTYSDQQGGVINIDFYIPWGGINKFSISSNPSGRYKGKWIGSTHGWHVKTTAKIELGSGDEVIDKDAGDAVEVS